MDLAAYLDHTNLKADARREDITRLCEEAAHYKMAAVCIHPVRVKWAARLLKGSGVKVCTVAGFPLGADRSDTKLNTIERAWQDGAAEVDMVINIGAVKDGDYQQVEQEIRRAVSLKEQTPFLLKVIVETALLAAEELAALTKLVADCGADFIKTSTGFAPRGVSLQDISIITAARPEGLRIKASGGIKDLDFALRLIEAGADRIGSSSAAFLMEEYIKRGGR